VHIAYIAYMYKANALTFISSIPSCYTPSASFQVPGNAQAAHSLSEYV